MALIIKGLNKMPKSCSRCILNYDSICCTALSELEKPSSLWKDSPEGFKEEYMRLPNCPLELKED